MGESAKAQHEVDKANLAAVKAEAKANTLREMKAELARLEAKLADNKKEQNSAQSGINESKQRIDQIAREKVDIEEEIESLSKEIVELNNDIIDMNGEIKDIISYYQLSSTGDSGALEYIFNADDYTELIYRMAITEQLSEYNSNAIKEYNAKISDNEKKKVSLANKKTQLGAKEIELEDALKKEDITEDVYKVIFMANSDEEVRKFKSRV